MSHYVINFSKLRIWEFVEYEKMVYLDGDIQVFDNIDHLFDLPEGYVYAVMDCFCEKTWSHTPQYKIGYCQQCPDRAKWPAAAGNNEPPSLYFNAGMFLFQPDLTTYHNLLTTLEVTPPTPFAEQDYLNMFFRNIYKPIPPEYNLVLAMLWRHPENIDLDRVKVVHYCEAGSKPWRFTGKEENMDKEDIKMLVKKWWDIYNDPSLDYKKTQQQKLQAATVVVGTTTPAVTTTNNTMNVNGDPQQVTALQPLIKEALSESSRLQYITAPSAA